MSNWALVIDVINGWVYKKGHPAVPVVSFILIILSLLVAAETIYALWPRKNAAASVQG